MLGDPHFFGADHFDSFPAIIQKNKKICAWEVNYFSYTIQIGSNWYMDTGVRDLEDVVYKANFS